MENGNYEQKYQESNILKNTDRYTKIQLYIKTRLGTHMAEIISSWIPCQGMKIGCRTLISVS